MVKCLGQRVWITDITDIADIVEIANIADTADFVDIDMTMTMTIHSPSMSEESMTFLVLSKSPCHVSSTNCPISLLASKLRVTFMWCKQGQ